MIRYCVLSIPRTGSSWFLNGIAFNLYKYKIFKDRINLDEFFKPYKYFEVGDANLIYPFEEKPIIETSTNDFIKHRLDILSRGSKKQPAVMKYMYWLDQGTDDIENLRKIKEYGFEIVNLNRDPFDSTISFLVSNYTGVGHHWYTDNEHWFGTSEGKQKNITAPSNITLDTYKFEVLYTQFLLAYDTKQKIADEMKCVTVNYETLKSDCVSNMIPFYLTPHSLKLYDTPYSSMITNYDQLLEIKSKVDNSITKHCNL